MQGALGIDRKTPVVIVLPGPPRGKGRPRFAMRGGRPGTYTDEKTRSYEGALRLAGAQAMAGAAPIDGALRVIVCATFPVPASWSKPKRERALAGAVRPTGKPDADNLLKVMDALNEVVFRDDAQVVEAVVAKVYGRVPSLRIEVVAA